MRTADTRLVATSVSNSCLRLWVCLSSEVARLQSEVIRYRTADVASQDSACFRCAFAEWHKLSTLILLNPLESPLALFGNLSRPHRLPCCSPTRGTASKDELALHLFVVRIRRHLSTGSCLHASAGT